MNVFRSSTFGALLKEPQFERRLIQERTRAGLEAARARGRKGGRKKIAQDDPRVLMAKKMHQDHGMSIANICKTLKISRASFYPKFSKIYTYAG